MGEVVCYVILKFPPQVILGKLNIGCRSTQILLRIKYNRVLARHISPTILVSDESAPRRICSSGLCNSNAMLRADGASTGDECEYLCDSELSDSSKTEETEEAHPNEEMNFQKEDHSKKKEVIVLYERPGGLDEEENSEKSERNYLSIGPSQVQEEEKKELKVLYRRPDNLQEEESSEKTERTYLSIRPHESQEEEQSEKKELKCLYRRPTWDSQEDEHSEATPDKELTCLYNRPAANRSCSSSELNDLAVQVVGSGTGKFKEQRLFSIGHRVPDTWKSPEHRKFLPEKSNLYDHIVKMARCRVQTNAIVTIGQNHFPVHLIVLQSYSGMFRDIGNEMSIELPAEVVTPRAFGLLYDWMIETNPFLPRIGLLELLHAAQFLQVPQLVTQCEACVATGFKEEAAAMLYLEAKLLKMEANHYMLLLRISHFFLTFVASKEFLDLPLKPLRMLLSSNDIGVNSELEVFMSAVRWLTQEWPKREGITEKVVGCIRFGLIPPWLLIRLQRTDISALEVRNIVARPEVRHGIHEGIAYTTTRIFYGADREAFKQHLQRTGATPPMHRNWIYDRNCRHHHRLHCKLALDFTFESFVEYLNYLQCQNRDYWQTFEKADASNVCLGCQRTQTANDSDPSSTTTY